jgi:hypothetical protein
MTAQKPVYMPVEIILIKKGCVFLMFIQLLKKVSPKTFGPRCVCNASLQVSSNPQHVQ